jgi:sec-independent protein translocase protein TatB
LFDIGWTELVVVAVVAILVVGPKDLPGMLRGFGRTISSLRRMGRDFQKQFDDALREAELDEVRNISSSKAFKPLEDARKSMEAYQQQVRGALNDDAPDSGPAAPKPATENASAPSAPKETAAPSAPKAASRRKTPAAKPAKAAPNAKATAKAKTAGTGRKKTGGGK